MRRFFVSRSNDNTGVESVSRNIMKYSVCGLLG